MSVRLLAALAALLVTAPAAHASKPRVAVLEIRAVEPSSKAAAEMLAEIMLTDLAKSGRFEVIGASDIASMLGFERQKQLLGCTEESSCLAEIGGALGVQWLITGSLGVFGSARRIDLKLVDTRRSRVAAREGATLETEDELLEWVRETLPKLTGAIGAKPAGGAASAPPAVAGSEQADGPGPRILPPVLVGAGALAVGAGLYLGYSALSFNDEKTNLSFDEARTARRGAETRMVVGGTLLAAGATTAVAGVALWLFGGDEAAPVAAITSDSVLLAVGGRF